MKPFLKNVVGAVSLVLVFPFAALSGFGRIRAVFDCGAQCLALAPGIPGDYLRVGFYRLTLHSCSPRCRISFGVLFSNPDAVVEKGVYIGPYSMLGRVRIGQGTQIAAHVQIISGAHQHSRDSQGNIRGADQGVFETVTIGAGSWIGAGAIVMASVGTGAIIGAGAVVTKEIPAAVVAVGNPARVIQSPGELSPGHS